MRSRLFLLLITLYWLLITGIGCAPTYPKEKFKESILRICRNEYKIDVKVETIGKTIAIYLPLTDLIDFNFALTKTAGDKINDVILSVSRAALSTDAKFDFYCVIAHDVRIPEIQIVIIKSVDDVKRFLLNDISRNEYSKRMLIDMRMSPQAQKERSIKDILSKMSVDIKAQDQIMNDFFRAEPAGLGDIGYWNGRFFIKDVSLSEFLAEEIASRVRMEFKEDKKIAEMFILKSSKGAYVARGVKNYFRFEVLAEQNLVAATKSAPIADKLIEAVLKVAGHVLHSYRFNDFDYVEVFNQSDGRTVDVSKERLEEFRKKKIALEEIVK